MPSACAPQHAADADCARLLVAGDEPAWTAFLAAYRGLCHGIACRYNRGFEFDDLFSLLIVKLLDHQNGRPGALRKYDGTASLKTYVCIVFKHLVLNHIRDTQTRSVTIDCAQPIEELPAHAPAQDEHEDEHELLAAAIARLPVHDQRLLDLHYRHGMTVRNIGAVIGCNGSTVSRHLARIQETLRTMIENAHAPHAATDATSGPVSCIVR